MSRIRSDSDALQAVEKSITKNIIFIGLTGSGKSSLIKVVSGKSMDKSSSEDVKMSFDPVTSQINYSKGNTIRLSDADYIIDAFDTVGFGDPSTPFTVILRQIASRLRIDLNEVHKVVFCFKMDRLRARMAEELNAAYKFFKFLGAKDKNFVIAVTFTDFYNKITIDKFIESLKKSPQFKFIEDAKLPIIRLAFPNFSECDDDPRLVDYMKEKVRESSKNVIREIIQAKEEPFNPLKALMELENSDFNMFCDLLTKTENSSGFFKSFRRDTAEDIRIELRKLKGMPDGK